MWEFYGFPVIERTINYDGTGTITLEVNKENVERIDNMSNNNIIWTTYIKTYNDSWELLTTRNNKKNIKEDKVIFNDNKKTTVVLWKDGTKTIVKASSNDKFDRRVGYLTAFYQKHCGMSKTKANKYIDSLEEDIEMLDVSEK